MRGSQNFKSGLHDPHMTPFDLILHFLLELTHLHFSAKFEVCSFNHSLDIRGFQNSESGSWHSLTVPIDLIFFVSTHCQISTGWSTCHSRYVVFTLVCCHQSIISPRYFHLSTSVNTLSFKCWLVPRSTLKIMPQSCVMSRKTGKNVSWVIHIHCTNRQVRYSVLVYKTNIDC